MAKEKFERKHLTEEEKNKLFHIGKESTEDEEKKAERAKKMIAEMYKNAKKAVIARDEKLTDGKDYKNIDGAPEPRESESTKTTDGDCRGR